MEPALIDIKNLSAKLGGKQLLHTIHLKIYRNQQWAIVGAGGSGKTSLAHALCGLLFHSGEIIFNESVTVEMVEQQHRFRTLSNTTDFYYQQRFQSQDADDAPTIREELAPFIQENKSAVDHWLHFLALEKLIDEPLIQLSNGENKRLQLCKCLLRNPSVLIMDMPFTGLDTQGRQLLRDIMEELVKRGIHLIVVCAAEDIPPCITHVAELNNGSLTFAGRREEFVAIHSTKSNKLLAPEKLKGLSAAPVNFDCAVKMVNVTIRYGERKILDNINWEVKRGECWSVSGPNGAGKSTLLSLISADNPQAYANEIYLFDKRRGRGESIWDIKKNIGLVSPEMHLYFPYTATCFEVIASGLFDTVGLFRALHEEQEQQVQRWLDILQLEKSAHRPLQQLSMSEQRITLLGRALVKNPPLLILDEPCQGLDDIQVGFFNSIVEQLCREFGNSLIYVSHYRHQLPNCIDHFLALREGRVVDDEEH